MPQPVIEYLSAPVPLLVGLPSVLLKKNNIDYQNFEDDINEDLNWVNIDDESESLWGSEIPFPYCGGLKERIRQDYDFIRGYTMNLVEHQNDEIDQKVKNIVDVIKDAIFETFIAPIPCSIGFNNFEESSSKFPKEIKSPRTQSIINKIEMADIHFDNSADQKFFSEFYYSLMFQTFLEEYTKPGNN